MNKYRITGLFGLLLCVLFLQSVPARAARNYTNEQEAFAYMISDMKLSPAAASGIMANIYAESNFSTTVWDSSGSSYGICQWLGSRKSALFNFCSSRGLDRGSLTAQLRFMEYELENIYPSTYNSIKNVSNDADGAYSAAYTFCYQFERPANKAYRSSQRGGYAKNIYWPEYGALSARLSAEPVDDKGISLSWQVYTGKTYLIYRSDSEYGVYKKIGKASAPGSGTYLDSTAKKGITYYYQLRSASEPKEVTYWSNKASALHSRKISDSECDISISKTEFTYSGKAKKPKVTVLYDGKELVKNRDYTVAYEKNINAGSHAAVIVTGIGDYSGTSRILFRIRKAQQKLDTALLRIPFSGKPEDVDVGQQGKITMKSSDRNVLKVKGSRLKALKYGRAFITINAASGKNYKAQQIRVEAVVVPPAPKILETKVVNADSRKSDVRVRWRARKAPEAFEIQYTTKNVFGHSARRVTVEKGKLRSFKLTGLDKGKRWRIRIRSIRTVQKKKVHSDWSGIVALGDS